MFLAMICRRFLRWVLLYTHRYQALTSAL